MARLANICEVCSEIFAGGDAPRGNMSDFPTNEHNIPIYSNGEANNGLYGYTNYARVTKPSITISARGTIGYTAIRNEPFVPIVRLITLTPNPDLIDIRYLYYAAQNYKFDGSGTSIPQLTVPQLKKYSFPLPTLEKQHEIASILDKISTLIELRKKQLSELDQLVKSRFIELFGVIPDSEHTTMTDVCSIITDGTHQPPKFTSSGIPFLFVSNIVTNKITYKTEKHISEETYAELIKRTPIQIGDILLSTVGSYGHPAVVETDERFCFQRHIAYLKPKKDIVNSRYLYGVLLSADVQKQIEEKVKGIAQK